MVLAGGYARRLGGADKPGVTVGGRTLAASVLSAAAEASSVIVVGPERPELCELRPAGLRFVREEPPGGGPVAALRRGLAEVRESWVAVLAADLPFLRAQTLRALLVSGRDAASSASPSSGAILVDADGRPQWLAGCWRTRALLAALATHRGSSLGGLLAPLRPVEFTVNLAAGEPPPWLDCDTPADIQRAQEWLP
ncbi:MAG: molybdenum cofactor guanylyltransferase [Micromonosporaceae bacterium]